MAAHLVTAGLHGRRLRRQRRPARRPGRGRRQGRRQRLAEAVAERRRGDHHAARLAPGGGGRVRRGRRARRMPKPGLLCTSTRAPSSRRPRARVAQEAGRTGASSVLDAPVSGGEQRAPSTAPCRSWWAARPRTSRRPGRSSVASAPPSCTSGPPAPGQTVKAANQLVVGGIYGLVAEAIVLLEASGVDPGRRPRRARRRPGRVAASSSSSATPWSSASSQPGFRDRPAPQGHGHRGRRRPRGRGRCSPGRAWSPSSSPRPRPRGPRLARPLRRCVEE